MRQKAFYLVVGAALLSGISGVIVKFMAIPATSMAWIRMATPTIIIGLWLLYKGRNILRPGFKMMLTASVFNTIRMLFFFLAYIYTSISNTIIVLYTWPIFAVLFSVIFLKEKVSIRQYALLFTSFLGILIVYAGHEFSLADDDFKGLTAGVICALFYSLTVIIFKSKTNEFDPFETIFFQNFLGALVFLPFFVTNTPVPRPLDWTLGLTHGVVIGIIMFTMFFYGLRTIKASTASMITYIEVIAAITFAYLMLDEVPRPNMIIGAVLILFSTLMLQKKGLRA